MTIHTVPLDMRDAITMVDSITNVLARATWFSKETLDTVIETLEGDRFSNSAEDKEVILALITYFRKCQGEKFE